MTLMDVTVVLSIFRLIAPEFKEVEDDIVKQWIYLTVPLVSRDRFRTVYEQALALLTAHRMKMAGVGQEGDDPIGDIGDIGIGNFMKVSSYKEGQTSISFDHNVGEYTGTDAELGLTEYGIQYLTLQRKKVMPIVSAGARFWR